MLIFYSRIWLGLYHLNKTKRFQAERLTSKVFQRQFYDRLPFKVKRGKFKKKILLLLLKILSAMWRGPSALLYIPSIAAKIPVLVTAMDISCDWFVIDWLSEWVECVFVNCIFNPSWSKDNFGLQAHKLIDTI